MYVYNGDVCRVDLKAAAEMANSLLVAVVGLLGYRWIRCPLHRSSQAEKLSVSIDIYNHGSAGAVLSHSFELESHVKTVFYSTPAVITFRVATKAALQEAYSTSLLPLEILSDKPKASALHLAKRLLGSYGSLVSAISIVVLFVFMMATPSKLNSAKGGKKKR